MIGSVSLREACGLIDAALKGRRLPAEFVPVRRAVGRVLARPQASRLDVPPFDKSAMDGYAVPEADPRGEFRVLATVAAGRVGPRRIEAGTAVKVMTGAPVPRGTRRVVMVEDSKERGGLVTFSHASGGTNICPRGEDVRRGDSILPEGHRIGPVDVANLVGCGISRVAVARRPRLALLATGDEIVDDASRLRPGRIMNSNGPMLEALCEARGVEVVLSTRLPDRLDALVRGLRRALDRADIVAFSGGVSVGDFDLVPQVLRRLGLRTRFSKVAVKPGRPATFAVGRNRVVFGLPGNPVSAYVAFHLFVLRAIARLEGAAPPERFIRFSMAREFRRRGAERREFVPARIRPDGRLEIIPSHGSAHLLALTRADGLAVVEAGIRWLAVGAIVEFLPLSVRWP